MVIQLEEPLGTLKLHDIRSFPFVGQFNKIFISLSLHGEGNESVCFVELEPCYYTMPQVEFNSENLAVSSMCPQQRRGLFSTLLRQSQNELFCVCMSFPSHGETV